MNGSLFIELNEIGVSATGCCCSGLYRFFHRGINFIGRDVSNFWRCWRLGIIVTVLEFAFLWSAAMMWFFKGINSTGIVDAFKDEKEFNPFLLVGYLIEFLIEFANCNLSPFNLGLYGNAIWIISFRCLSNITYIFTTLFYPRIFL